MLQQRGSGVSCKMGAILKCQFLVVPSDDIPIFPPGVIQLPGFDGTCSQDCADHLASDACTGEESLRAEVAATCAAYRCWDGVSRHCGRFVAGKRFNPSDACSQACGDAISAATCNGTEAIFPSFAIYKANVGPTGRDCSTRACSRNHLALSCPRYNKARGTVAPSDLCSGVCYRALFREPCLRSRIQVAGPGGEALGPWDTMRFNGEMYGPLSPLCANVTNVTFTVTFADYDYEELRDPAEGERFSGSVGEALEDVLELLGIASEPAVSVGNLRPGSVAADITLSFRNDPGGAILLQRVLEANPGLLLSEFGTNSISNIQVETIPGELYSSVSLPTPSPGPAPTPAPPPSTTPAPMPSSTPAPTAAPALSPTAPPAVSPTPTPTPPASLTPSPSASVPPAAAATPAVEASDVGVRAVDSPAQAPPAPPAGPGAVVIGVAVAVGVVLVVALVLLAMFVARKRAASRAEQPAAKYAASGGDHGAPGAALALDVPEPELPAQLAQGGADDHRGAGPLPGAEEPEPPTRLVADDGEEGGAVGIAIATGDVAPGAGAPLRIPAAIADGN